MGLWWAVRVLLMLGMIVSAGGIETVGAEARGEEMVKVTLLEGKAVLLSSGATKETALNVGAMLRANQIFRTERDSRVELLFPDFCTVRLGPESRFGILSVRGNPKINHGGIRIILYSGDVWVNAAASRRACRFGVATAACLSETDDGVYRIVVYPDQTVEVKSYRGAAEISGPPEGNDPMVGQRSATGDKAVAGPEKDLWSSALAPLTKTVVSPSAKPLKPFRFPAKADRNRWVLWNLQRDNDAVQ